MTTDELAAAAERVRDVMKGDGTFWDRYDCIYKGSERSLVGDEALLADAYLAQHPCYSDVSTALDATMARESLFRDQLKSIVSMLQRKLQPGGSPPPGDEMVLAAWVIDSAHARLAALDDPRPLTPELMVSTLGEPHGNAASEIHWIVEAEGGEEFRVVHYKHIKEVSVYRRRHNPGIAIANLKTVGRFRSLCHGLGVAMKGGAV